MNKCKYLVTFGLGNLKSLQRGIEVPQEYRPIAVSDFHSIMGGLHISPGVVHGTAGAGAQKINEELLSPPDTIRFLGAARNDLAAHRLLSVETGFGNGNDGVIAAKAFIE